MKVGLLFPDYGSQFVGMGKELYDTSRLMQEYFEEASNCLNINFVKLCFASSDLELARIDHAYPSLFLISSAIAAVAQEHGIKPVAVAGYGLGEYAALQTVGSLSLPDGLYFLTKYAQLYQPLLDDTKLRISRIMGSPIPQIEGWCRHASRVGQSVSIAAYHTSHDVEISGNADAVDQVSLQAVDAKSLVTDIPVEAGLHSKLMAPVATHLAMYAEKIDINDARIPLISGVDGIVRSDGDALRQALLQQITDPIRWDRVMTHIGAWDIVVEIGPGSTLSSLISSIWPDKKIYPLGKLADIEQLITLLGVEQQGETE